MNVGPSDRGKEILIMNIELAHGRTVELIVHEHDEPCALAHGFCHEHHLDLSVKGPLAAQIQKNVQNQLRTSSIGRQVPSSQELKQFPNTGQKLYYKGVRMKERTERNIQRLKQLRAANEARDSTFHPTTNNSGCGGSRREHSLIQKGQEYTENQEKRRDQRLAEELDDCTFTPAINQKTVKEVSPSRFNFLYVNARQRAVHRAQLSAV